MQLSEDLLQFIWRKQAYDHDNLRTSSGEPLVILDPGRINRDSGPDFSNARIRIGNIEWVGHIEVHIRSSMWPQHGHHLDPAYDNVVLHVVFDHDKEIPRSSGKSIPTLEIGNKIDPNMLKRYSDLMATLDDIPCQNHIADVDRIKVLQWTDRMLVQRLERKSEFVASLVAKYEGDIQKALFVSLAGAFGGKVNARSFERLAEVVPLNVIASHRKDRVKVEALLYGLAGLLEHKKDDPYLNEMLAEYRFLQVKHGLTAMKKVEWKWGRMRPAGFPTIRISQIAGMLAGLPHGIGQILEVDDPSYLVELIRASAHDYWADHSHFGRSSKTQSVRMGEEAASRIVINSVVPFQFFLGNHRKRPELKERAIGLLERMAPEENRIIRRWKSLGVELQNAGGSQALIELYNLECLNKKCLFCGIGGEIIGQRDHRKTNP